uniref:DM13 domain-containing protein n=1 Tax=Parascaris univalens TaxID=6257 RepID=A0A915C876_PARUN
TGAELTTLRIDEVSIDSSPQPSAAPIIFFRKSSEGRTTESTLTMADDRSQENDSAHTTRSGSTSSDYAAVTPGNTAESDLASSILDIVHEIPTTNRPGLVAHLSDRYGNANDRFRYRKEYEQEDVGAPSDVEWITKSDSSVRNKGGGHTIILGGTTTTDWPRRAPFLHHAIADKIDRSHADKDDSILSDKFFETDNIVPVSTQRFITPSPALKSTPLYYVIEDPRAKRRRPKERSKGIISASEHQMATTDPSMATNVHFDRKYALPVVDDKTAAFALTNGAKIVDYQWIGLYDQCRKRAIPLLSLKGIDPPREEKISPISGWSHNVTSYRVQILNCNSLLIPGFVYNDTGAPPGTFFYVGIGHFPDNIEKQVRTGVVGHPLNEPLRSYMREDVMLRLPKTYRTFDIDFLSIYNEVEKRSYGHVVIPSLLVPPCSEID